MTRTTPQVIGRPISPSTALQLERILEGVFEEGGTAAGEGIDGYRLAGKTGTAQKVVDGRYSQTRFVANFIGFAPARRPALAALVAIDEPRAGLTSGGRVAAPVFAAIARRVLPYLGVAPEPCRPWSARRRTRVARGTAPIRRAAPPAESPGG